MLRTAFIGLACLGAVIPLNGREEKESDKVWDLPPYTVTGTRIHGIELETTVPTLRQEIADLEMTGFSRPDEALRALPVVGLSFDEANEETEFVTGISQVNLRQMMAELVLIDGKRLAMHAGGGGVHTLYDFNGIPSSAIAGVEILLDGASAIYGSDAVSGVINIRTIRKFEGTRLNLGTGIAEGTDSWEFFAELQHGQKLGGYANLVLTLDYYQRNNLQRKEYAHMEATHFTDRGGFDRGSYLSYPASFFVTDPQHPLYFFAVYDPVTYDEPTDKPGLEGLTLYGDRDRFNFNEWSDYLGDREHRGAYLHLDGRLSDRIRGYIDLFYRRTWNRTAMAPTPYLSENDFTFPAANPFNPFGESRTDGGTPMDLVYFRGRLVDAGPRVCETVIRTPRIVGGLEGRLAGDWEWTVAGVWSESRTEATDSDRIHYHAFQEALNGVDLDGNGFVAKNEYLNPFGPNSGALIDHMRIDATRDGRYELRMLDAHATGDLSSGKRYLLKAAAGAEYREESLDHTSGPAWREGLILGSGVAIADTHGGRDAASVYGELFLEFGDWLEIQLAERFERYSDVGDTDAPKISASARVFPELLVRASYGEAFMAPFLPYLHKPDHVIINTTHLPDPKRNEPVGTFYYSRAGNPELKPSDSRHWSAGLVVQPFAGAGSIHNEPGWPAGLTAGLDYFNIDYLNLIDEPGLEWLLANEDDLETRYPGQGLSIERAEPLPDDAYGPITWINSRFINREDIAYEDLVAWLEWPVAMGHYGNLKIRSDYHHEISRVYDGEELAGQWKQGPRYRWTGWLTWSKGHWESSWFFRYLASLPPLEDNPNTPVDESAYPTGGPSFRVNAQVSYSGLWETRFTIGARNLFNEEPAFDAFTHLGYNDYFPAEKRFWYFRMERNW